MKITIEFTPQPGADPEAIGESLFDVLCHYADGELVETIDSWEPVRESS